jgi:endonuclease
VQFYDKPVRLLMRDMLTAMALTPGQTFTRKDVTDWFAQHYPKIKAGTLNCHLSRFSINAPSRLHFNYKPFEDDLLFQIDGNHFRLYDAKTDPSPIRSWDEVPVGRGPGTRTATPGDDQSDDDSCSSGEFAYESDLRNYLAKNLSIVEAGLKLYTDEEITGVEFNVGGRFIDILAVASGGDLVVIELKVSRGYDRVVGQLMRYMAWIQKNQAEPGQKVRGVIVAREISEDLRLACSLLRDVQLFEYEMSLRLKPVIL